MTERAAPPRVAAAERVAAAPGFEKSRVPEDATDALTTPSGSAIVAARRR